MKEFIKKQIVRILMLTLSIILFSLSFPGFINRDGIAIVSFIALLPMFMVIYRLNYLESLIYGFIFGLCKYLVFNFWFKAFDPAAFAVAPGIHGMYFLVFFPLTLFFFRRFPKLGYLPITFSWLAYEVFKSTNAVGFSYGVLSQSMYRTHLFTGVADIIGSYVLSLLIIFPTILVSFLFSKGIKSYIVPSSIYLLLLITSIIYTSASKVDYSDSETIRLSLVQHNLNCWLSTENSDLYAQAYDHLESLSREGEKQGAEVVIWSETAFVPAIEWHKKWRRKNERERYDLIKRMERYLSQTEALYIIGNNESFNKDRDEHYNTAYLYNKDQIINRYRKINLVPFTEQFPYPELFPWLFEYVKKLGAKQIMPGKEQTLFDISNNAHTSVLATLLICYEDAFPDLPREGVKQGSDLLINITNDAWTSYPATALQHLAAAALRTIETRRSLVRSGTSGFTGVIDPNGKIIASLPLFTKDQLTFDVPIYRGDLTFYTKHGHIIDNLGYILLAISLVIGFIKLVKTKSC